MSVTVFSWNYHIKNKLDYFHNNKTPGHCALEITGNYKEIQTIKENFLKTFPEYVKSKKIYENYICKPQDIDKFISKKLSEQEKINYRILDLEECIEEYCKDKNSGLIKAALKNISSETVLAYVILMRYEKIFDKKIIFYSSQVGKNIVYHMYFSVFPKSDSSEMGSNFINQHSPGSSVLSKLTNFLETEETLYYKPIFKSFNEDSIINAKNVDIEEIFRDIHPNNLREINNINNYSKIKDKNLIKKTNDIKYFEVINGKLSGIIISAKSINLYKNFFHFLFRIKSKDFRKSLFDYYIDGQEVNKKILSSFLKNNIRYVTTLKNDVSKFLKQVENQFLLSSHPMDTEIFLIKIQNIKKLLEILENVEYKIQILNDFSGIPPTEIVTLPSKICDWYGVDENIIVAKWMTTVVNTGFDLLTTNCAWSIKTILFPAVKEYYSESSQLRLYSWLPREVIKISRIILKNILKKHSNFVIINSYRAPKKKLLTKQQFLDLYIKNCFSLKVKYQLNTIPNFFINILELLKKYQYLGDFYLLQRLIIIEQIKEIISAYFDENYKTSISKEKKEFSILRNLYQNSLNEEQIIMSFFINNNT